MRYAIFALAGVLFAAGDPLWLTDADAGRIAAQKDLRKLDLSFSLIGDAGMEKIRALPNVTDLNLYAVEHITDVAIAYIREWKLRRLNLRGTDITDTSLQYLAGMTTLQSLDISYTQVTNNGMEYLAALRDLEELEAGGNKLTGVGLRVLKLLPKLRTVNLGGVQKRNSGFWLTTLTDLDYDALAGLAALRDLNLASVKVTDPGVARLKQVRSLDLSRTPVAGKGFENLTALEKLTLWQAKRVDDSAMPGLAKLPKLQNLDISETAVGDEGLKALAAAPAIRRIAARRSKITAAGVEAFRRAKPDCEVSWQ